MSEPVSQGQERVPVGLPAAETTNRDLWHWRVGQTPDREWLRFEGRSWTYSEFDLEMRRLAAGLQAIGVGPGDRVLLGMKNRPETLQAQLALSELGAVSVPVLAGLPLGELGFPVRHSEATIMIADDPVASLLAEHRDEFATIERIVALDDVVSGEGIESFESLIATEPLPHEPIEGYDGQSLDLIVYTSGSTGRPKGVMLKAGSMLACGLGYADLYQITADDRYICTTPLSHSLGAIAATSIAIVTGGPLTLVERFRPSRFWNQVDESGATVSVLFATHLNLLLEVDDGSRPADGSSFRLVITHIYHPRFAERFGVRMATIWGMSETCICSGSDPGYRGDLDPGYIGRPFAGGEMAIFDPESQERLAPGQDGELWLRHPQVMLGYLNDPEATAKTLTDGWVRSGDRAYQDHCGRTFFVGRYKAMIKRSGENVSAEEVEAALLAHPEVIECCVLGVPDPMRSEEVAAVAVVENRAALPAADLREFCGNQLVRWKLPRYITVQEEPLPKLANEKVDRVASAASFVIEESWDADGSGEE